MKRSRINALIREAKQLLEERQFHLPPLAYWPPERWSAAGPECERIIENGLGWDVTDLGMNQFDKIGAVIFTLRNGNCAHPERGTPYAEKIIIIKPGQALPLHFHWSKTEDIINRGGGILAMQLYKALEDDGIDRASPAKAFCDGSERTYQPGEVFELHPGESITVTPRLFHSFWASEKGGTLLCGEVSSVNDDRTDNCFAEPLSRFSQIEEDEPPIHLLCNEYPGAPKTA